MKQHPKLASLGIVILVVLVSPVILVGLLIDRVAYLFTLPKLKRTYYGSAYYKDLSVPYSKHLLHSPQYRVYNSLKKQGLYFQFRDSYSNDINYFVYENTLYLLENLDQIQFNENKRIWEAVYDGDPTPLDGVYEALSSKVKSQEEVLPIKLLVERRLIAETDLRGMELPDYVTLIRSYDRAFQEEDPQLTHIIPTDEKELYDMMGLTPGLCGTYRIAEDNTLIWDLYDKAELHIGVHPMDCTISVHRKGVSKFRNEITHWHCDIYSVYDEICTLGKPGNVLVIRSSLLGESTYQGSREECPYKENRNTLFGRVYYFLPSV